MAFKVNNLIIHVLPDMEEKNLPHLALAQPQDCGIPIISPLFNGPCAGTTRFIPPYPTFGMSSDPETLAILKVQLQEALASVQAQEKAINEQMSPKTVEEAQTLENHLTAALEEVLRQKEDSRKRLMEDKGNFYLGMEEVVPF